MIRTEPEGRMKGSIRDVRRSALLSSDFHLTLSPTPQPGDICIRGDHHSPYLIYAGASGEYRVPNGVHNMPPDMAADARKVQVCWGRCAYMWKSVFKFDVAAFEQCMADTGCASP